MSVINDKIQVIVRIRPPYRNDLNITTKVNANNLFIKDKVYSFDNVYDVNSNQFLIFNESIRPLINHFLSGINTTIFTYGQTGSGKTYTMGTDQTNLHFQDDNCGIIPRFLFEIFRLKSSNLHTYQFSIQFLELYNEEIRDLLVIRNQSSNIRIVDTKSGTILAGLSEKPVNSAIEALFYLNEGNKARTTASTFMNAESSRSHAIFTLHLIQKKINVEKGITEIIKSKFHFVDLAGSERLQRTKASGTRAKEGIHINYGLLALGNVICALTENKPGLKRHIPYRDSKLTRLLEDSLGGNSKCMMIACICPLMENMLETCNTLCYADRVNGIKNKILINHKTMLDDVRSCHNCHRMQQRISELERELCRIKNGSETISVLEEQAERIFDSQKKVTNETYEETIKDFQSLCYLMSLEEDLKLLNCLPAVGGQDQLLNIEKHNLYQKIREVKDFATNRNLITEVGKTNLLLDCVNKTPLKTKINALEINNCVITNFRDHPGSDKTNSHKLRWNYLLNFTCQQYILKNCLQQKIIDLYERKLSKFYEIFQSALFGFHENPQSILRDLLYELKEYTNSFDSQGVGDGDKKWSNPISVLANLENSINRMFPLPTCPEFSDDGVQKDNEEIFKKENTYFSNQDYENNKENCNDNDKHYDQLPSGSADNLFIPEIKYDCRPSKPDTTIHKPFGTISRKKSMIINQEGTVLENGFIKSNGLCLPIISSPRKQKLCHTQSMKPTFGSRVFNHVPIKRKAEPLNIVKNFRSRLLMNFEK